MTKLSAVRVTLSCGIALAGVPTLAQAQAVRAGAQIPHQFILRAGPDATIEQLAFSHSLTVLGIDGLSGRALVESDGSRPDDDELSEISGDHDVERIEPNRYFALSRGNTQSFFVNTIPSAYLEQPAPSFIGARAIHRVERGGGVIVAVLDTGVSPHSVLDPYLLPGYNAFDGSSNARDLATASDTNQDGNVDSLVGHGTMIAGIIHQVAPDSLILPIKVLDADGFGDAFTITAGVRQAIASGAHVINLSLSSPVESEALEQALRDADDAGIVVVASIGNNNRRESVYPAAFHGVIAVAATTMSDQRASFSSYGTRVDICAPGVGIVGTMPDGGYAVGDGSSFSSALVAGAAALVRHNIGGDAAIADRVWTRLAEGAVPIDNLNPGLAGWLGVGRLSLDGIIHGSCASDLDDGSGQGIPDQTVTSDDFFYFIGHFENGDVRVDLDDGSGSGHCDGAIDVGDLLFFLEHFEAGC